MKIRREGVPVRINEGAQNNRNRRGEHRRRVSLASDAKLISLSSSFSATIHSHDHISTACAQLESFFLLRQPGQWGNLRSAPLNHGFGTRDLPTKSILGVVSLLRPPLSRRRTIQGAEGLPAGLVFEYAVCIMGLGTTGIFARRRAVMAPRECAHSAIL